MVFALVLFTRFYNLEKQLRFNRDESSDLVKIHQYWVDKDITLIGPMSEDGNMVYSSLSYYLIMPFALLFNFTPVSPTIGNAFISIVGLLILIITTYLTNKRLTYLACLLLVIWYPYLLSSRWAWNPNLIPALMAGGYFLLMSKKNLLTLLAGVLFGFTSHLHYLAIIPSALFLFSAKNKILFILGFSIPILIFLTFDFFHPPGLFLSRTILYKQSSATLDFNFEALSVGLKFLLTRAWILICCLPLLVNDIRFNRKNLLLLTPVLSLFIAVGFIKSPQGHYFIGALIPWYLWLILPREKIWRWVQPIIFFLMVVINLPVSLNYLFGKIPDDSAYFAKRITNIIAQDIIDNELKNPNLAVLQSNDINSFGVKYRDILLVNDVRIRSIDEYSVSDNLYVITQEGDDKLLRGDPSVQMRLFNTGVIRFDQTVSGSNWRIIRFDRY
jgi:hypothetical protein